MFIIKNLFRVYRDEVNGDGDAGGADTTSVQTDNSDTLLTNSDASTADADDNGGENTTKNDADASSQIAPDTYADFVMPEGVKLDSALLAEATPLFKDLGLTQEQAQKVVDFQAKQAKASSESQVDTFDQLMNDWRDKSKNDKEFGGDKFEENIKVAQSAIDKFGTPELKQLLEEHGVGNHPEVIRFMIKVGKLTAEDVPGGTTTVTSQAQDRVSLLYPTDKTA